jgi:hypothetical protein
MTCFVSYIKSKRGNSHESRRTIKEEGREIRKDNEGRRI